MELPKTKKTTKDEEVKTIDKTNVFFIPMTEESYKEWQKAFSDMEECFEYLKKQKQQSSLTF